MLLHLLLLAAAAVVHGHEGHDHHADSEQQPSLLLRPDSCVQMPTMDNCTTYTYPDAAAAADVASLCNAMPFMPTCSAVKACNGSSSSSSTNSTNSTNTPGAALVQGRDTDVCSPFNQLATICSLDDGMSGMSGCRDYNSLCINGSKVTQCSEEAGISALPTTKTVNDRVRSICEEMSHSGCEACTPSWKANKTYANCDLLDAYGSNCYEMPDMVQCQEWHEMCATAGDLWVCKKYPTNSTSYVQDADGVGAGSNAAGTAAPAKNLASATSHVSKLMGLLFAAGLLLVAVLA